MVLVMLKVIGAVVLVGAAIAVGAKVVNRLRNKGERETPTGQGSRYTGE